MSQLAALTPAQAARELLRRRRGRASLAGYANAIDIPGKPAEDDPEGWLFKPVETGVAAHHLLLLQAVERTAARRYGRLMVFMPPGSAKSTYCSVVAPSYLMGRQPDRRFILASYGSDLAKRMGRRARQVVKSPGFASIFGCDLSASTSAADEWALTNGSEYLAGGILSGITGNRAHGLFIDDPVKGREQADSPTIRQKTWDAYQDDLLTRLIPGGFVVLVQCMTGDTRVLLSDGTERDLREIKPGDEIATYEGGKLRSSFVKHWVNNGPDSVYRIKMKSGAEVKANERHPFLVETAGGPRWVRLKDLKKSDCILRVIGGSGEASSAPLSGALMTSCAPACAPPTTTKSVGLKEFGRHLLEKIRRLASAPSSSTDTASPSTTTSAFYLLRAAAARSASVLRRTLATLSTGATSCALTTATTQAGYAGFSVTTAISPSAEGKRPKCSKLLRATSDFTPDEVVSIEPCGVEDVFDIQVDRTENFIANGLVSHNTRWHEDDLAGRILPKDYAGQSGMVQCRDGKEWEVINLPAQCEREDDPLGRRIGEMLWQEWFDEEHWRPFRLQSRTWAALFQQRPRPDTGGIFKEVWCQRRYTAIPPEAKVIVHSWDTAQKEAQINDPTVGTVWHSGRCAPGHYLREVFRERIDYPTLRRKVIAMAERDHPAAILIEDKSSGQSLIQELRSTTSLPVIAIEPYKDKVFRANEVSSMVEAGLLHLPDAGGILDHLGRPMSAPWLADFEGEFFGFPLSTNDDQVDSVTQYLKWARVWTGRMESVGSGQKRETVAVHDNDDHDGFGSVGRGDESIEGF